MPLLICRLQRKVIGFADALNGRHIASPRRLRSHTAPEYRYDILDEVALVGLQIVPKLFPQGLDAVDIRFTKTWILFRLVAWKGNLRLETLSMEIGVMRPLRMRFIIRRVRVLETLVELLRLITSTHNDTTQNQLQICAVELGDTKFVVFFRKLCRIIGTPRKSCEFVLELDDIVPYFIQQKILVAVIDLIEEVLRFAIANLQHDLFHILLCLCKVLRSIKELS